MQTKVSLVTLLESLIFADKSESCNTAKVTHFLQTKVSLVKLLKSHIFCRQKYLVTLLESHIFEYKDESCNTASHTSFQTKMSLVSLLELYF